MEIVRNVTEIEPADRTALENVLGQQLLHGQQVVVRVVTPETNAAPRAKEAPPAMEEGILPEWCNVFEGLSDAEIAAIEEVILTRANLTRPSERIATG